jgi:hypothetical protein
MAINEFWVGTEAQASGGDPIMAVAPADKWLTINTQPIANDHWLYRKRYFDAAFAPKSPAPSPPEAAWTGTVSLPAGTTVIAAGGQSFTINTDGVKAEARTEERTRILAALEKIKPGEQPYTRGSWELVRRAELRLWERMRDAILAEKAAQGGEG